MIPEYMQRVYVERDELQSKHIGLNIFLNSGKPSHMDLYDYGLLVNQEKHMSNYLKILNERIRRFEDSTK